MDRLLREGNPPTGQLASPKPQYKDVQTNNWEELKGEGGASYVKDRDVLAKLEQARVLLAGVATETKLEEARALLESVAGKDFATQATLAQVKSELELVKAELAAIKANQLSGDQKVQQVGNNVLIASGANFEFEVAPGASAPTSQTITYDYKNFTWLYVRVLAQNGHDFEVEQEIPGYTRLKIAGKSLASIIFLSDPFRPLGDTGRIWIRNKSLNPQKYNFQIYGMTSGQATLEVVQSELALIKSELDNIKQNQTSGDQKVQLSGTTVADTQAIPFSRSTRDLQGEAMDEIISIIGAENIACCLPMWQDAGETIVRDLINPNLSFDVIGNATLGNDGMFGPCLSSTAGGLLERAVDEHISGASIIYLTSPAMKLATKITGVVGEVRYALAQLFRTGTLDTATVKLSIYTDDGGKPGVELYNPLLGREYGLTDWTTPCSAISSAGIVWRGFTLKQPLQLLANATYWLVLEYVDGTGVDAGNCIGWVLDDAAGNGRANYDGATWNSVAGKAHNYALYTGLALEDEWTIVIAAQDVAGDAANRFLFTIPGMLREQDIALYKTDEKRMCATYLPAKTSIRAHVYHPASTLWTVHTMTYDKRRLYDTLHYYTNGRLSGVSFPAETVASGVLVNPHQAQPFYIGGDRSPNGLHRMYWSGNIGPVLVARRTLSSGEVGRVTACLNKLRTRKGGDYSA